MREENGGGENEETGVVGRKRRREKGVEQEIEMEEWERYFKELLRGVEWRVKREGGRNKEVEENKRER